MNNLSYESITAITQSPQFLIIIIFAHLIIGLFGYLLIAGFTSARTKDGRKLKSSMLSHGNALIPIIVWIIESLVIVFGLIFPFWAKII